MHACEDFRLTSQLFRENSAFCFLIKSKTQPKLPSMIPLRIGPSTLGDRTGNVVAQERAQIIVGFLDDLNMKADSTWCKRGDTLSWISRVFFGRQLMDRLKRDRRLKHGSEIRRACLPKESFAK